jgi:hypothetical protein
VAARSRVNTSAQDSALSHEGYRPRQVGDVKSPAENAGVRVGTDRALRELGDGGFRDTLRHRPRQGVPGAWAISRALEGPKWSAEDADDAEL